MRGMARTAGRKVATVFFTDMVGSTELVARLGDQRWRELLSMYQRAVRRAIRSGGGREVDSAGDGLFALFDSPAAAIEAAAALMDDLHRRGIEVRTGVHTGEVELMGDRVGGIAVHLGARVAARAAPGEILVTGTVRDLMTGSEVRWVDRGLHDLKGIPGQWQIYAVETSGAAALDVTALDQAVARPPSRRRRVWVALAGAAVAAVAGGTAAIVATHRSDNAAPSLVVPDAETVSRLSLSAGGFVTSVKTGGSDPIRVAVGGGHVWVVNYHSGTLVRMSSSTGQVEGTSAVPQTPTDIAYADGALWLTTLNGGNVLHFDIATNSFDAVVHVGDGARGLAIDGSRAVWTTDSLKDLLLEIDPTTHGLTLMVSLGEHVPTSVAASNGVIWVGCADDTLLRFDPERDRAPSAFQVGVPLDALAVRPDAVWAASDSGSVVIRIDPATGHVVTTIPVDGGPDDVAAGVSSVWVTASRAGRVDRIDVATNMVSDRYRVGGTPRGVAVDGDDAWVSSAAQ